LISLPKRYARQPICQTPYFVEQPVSSMYHSPIASSLALQSVLEEISTRHHFQPALLLPVIPPQLLTVRQEVGEYD
jgi:hypothetical protein